MQWYVFIAKSEWLLCSLGLALLACSAFLVPYNRLLADSGGATVPGGQCPETNGICDSPGLACSFFGTPSTCVQCVNSNCTCAGMYCAPKTGPPKAIS
jgi:hypothetical protein